MNRIAKMAKFGGLLVLVALMSGYLGANTASQFAGRDLKLERPALYQWQWVDDPQPCPQC